MIDKVISRYKILEKLGAGGMGEVYLAEDNELDRKVALKFLPSQYTEDPEINARFKREAKAAAALSHPNIITVYDVGEHEGKAFIAMEYIGGHSLKDLLGKEELSISKITDITIQICEGLREAHQAGIVHRDIKPDNILIDSKGKVKIADFGLAKLKGATKLTQESSMLGTVNYMSPEQIQSTKADHRSDIFSVGVVLYEMITGHLPFEGDYEAAVSYSILQEEPEPLARYKAGASQGLQGIVDKALEKDRETRYQSIADLLSDLKRQTRDKDAGQVTTVAKKAKLPWLIAAAIVVLMAISIYFFMPASKPGRDTVQTIAVLPFADMSPKKDQEYFSDGLTEELLNVLAKNPKLRVTSRTSAFSFKGTNTDIRTIAEKLNVKHILEGSVRKSGNQIRITAQLVDVATDAHLWSETYDRELENIFAVQDNISRAVAEALMVTLLGGETQLPKAETDPEAYNAYLQGVHFLKQFGNESLEKAIGYYEQALAIDSVYAPAWVGLSDAHGRQAAFGFVPVEEGSRKARQEAEKALELDPNLASAHVQMGLIKRLYDLDWAGADAAFQRALELEPGNSEFIQQPAALAATLGRFEEALAQDRRAVELDPVSALARIMLGIHARYAGLLEEAEAAFRKALELNPQFPGAHMNIGLVYLATGNPDSALAEMVRETETVWRMFGFALAYHSLGKKKEADAVLAEFIQEYQNEGAYQIAQIYAYRGETDQASEWLERAYQRRDSALCNMKVDPLLRSIENDPRYAAVMKKMKLPM